MASKSRKFCHEDYTVAWICALSLEMTAAKAMLDCVHPNLPSQPNDHNTYTLGNMQGHNVVIACLPTGIYGTISATAVASQVLNTFKSIRFGLMVGIGGGVPSKIADIRLGDVVVSKPTGTFGGVIQYDYGKAVNEGKLERTGMLNKPPQILLTAVSKLQADHMLEDSQIPMFLHQMEERYPHIQETFRSPGPQHDLLFNASYEHKKSQQEQQDTCSSCERSELVPRAPRATTSPAIHYGLIASGNQVIKHARTRDQLAQGLGILCIEMEAAGLMDIFPCLVIRGICDYADSHKQKQWQKYAAATSAAYAKELLSVTQLYDSGDGLTKFLSIGETRKRGLLPYKHRKTERERLQGTWMVHCRNDHEADMLLERLSSYDHEKAHRRLSRKRLAGTTQWFLDHPDFRTWLKQKSAPCLWCSGRIGSGKTIIATAVVEAVKARRGKATIFVYCEDEERKTHSASDILSSFIKQLLLYLRQTLDQCPNDVIRDIFKFFGEKGLQPDLEDLRNVFTRLFKLVPETLYVLDGFDALCQLEAAPLLELFSAIFGSSSPVEGQRILLLSRDHIPGHIDITRAIPGTLHVSTSYNVLRDIELYVETRVSIKLLCHRTLTDDPRLVEEIKHTLAAESSGMFLWAHLQLEILWDTCFTDAEIRNALRQLPKGLEETYLRCIDRINFQDHRPLKVLKWVSFASRALHIEELREAVAFTIFDESWDGSNIPQADFVIGCCKNLVVLDPVDDCVRFAHSSVKQYLQKGQPVPEYPRSAEEGDLECGELCVAYLSFSDFGLQLQRRMVDGVTLEFPEPLSIVSQNSGPVASAVSAFSKVMLGLGKKPKQSTTIKLPKIRTLPAPNKSQYKFLDYATASWTIQTKDINPQSFVWNQFQQLALCFNESWNIQPWVPSGRSYPSLIHGILGWALKERHKPLLSIALKAVSGIGYIIDLPLVGEALPALHVATRMGYTDGVRILLPYCQINLRDIGGLTALHHSANKGHIDILRLLINNGAEIDVFSYDHRSPLWMASGAGHEHAVALLLDQGADVEAPDTRSRSTPLHQACMYGHFSVVRILLKHSARFEVKDATNQTPVVWAFRNRHRKVLHLLLEWGASFNGTSVKPSDVRLWAAENGYHEIISIMPNEWFPAATVARRLTLVEPSDSDTTYF